MTLLVSIQSMLGSIEWILPVCKYLKDYFPDTNIIFIIYRKDKKEIFLENRGLNELMNEISFGRCYSLLDLSPVWVIFISRIFSFLEETFSFVLCGKLKNFWIKLNWKIFEKRVLQKFINKVKPEIGLMDSCRNQLFTELKHKCIKRGFFLTSPSFAFSSEVWVDKDKRLSMYSGSNFDFFLVDTDWTSEFFKSFCKDQPIYKIGTPKFDTWWIEYIEKRTRCLVSDYLDDSNSQNNILILLKNESSAVFKEIDFATSLREIIEVCLKKMVINIIIKPHPRQSIGRLKKIISDYSGVKIVISHEPSFALISKVPYVVSMPSGIILDALIMGRPVIEYFNYVKYNNILKHKFGFIPKNALGGMSFIDKEGHLTSVFRAKDLVFSADTPQELEVQLSNLNNGRIVPKRNSLRDIYPEDASRKAAEAIFSMIDGKLSAKDKNCI